MVIKLGFAAVITVLFYLRQKVSFKWKVFLHPILLTPLLGSYFGWGGFITGLTVGGIVELIWGSNLVDYQAGLKYGLLVSLLTVSLVFLTNNINLAVNLSLVIILVFSFQISCSFLAEKKYFVGLVFLFNLLVLSGAPLVKLLLGWLPAQFLNNIEVASGLVPVVGLALLVMQGINPDFKRNNVWYYAYTLAALVTAVFVLNNRYFGLAFFPLIWYTVYYLWKQVREVSFRDYLRKSVVILTIIFAPKIVELSSYLIDGSLQYILWVDVLLALTAGLRFFKLTGIELYFIVMLVGIAGAQFGLLG